MDSEPEKILVAGNVNGDFSQLYKKVEKIIGSHGNFSTLLIVGNFFGDSESSWLPYKQNIKSACIDTYILGPSSSLYLKYYPNYNSSLKLLKLSNNIFCFGKFGVFVTTKGLTIAYLSGTESKETSLFNYSELDILKLMQIVEDNTKYKPIDIFITSQWPKGITDEFEINNPSTMLQKLVKSIVPRYIFCAAEGKWYKRTPYNNCEPYSCIITRFIGLGSVNTKEKWLYALELSKDIPETRKPMHTVNPSPFSNVNIDANDSEEQYRWDMRRYDLESKSGEKKKQHFRKRRRVDDAECWFCLASPKVEKHLIIHFGKDLYVARAKGGLLDNHLLISTVNHIKCFVNLSDSSIDELKNLKLVITRYFKKMECSPIFFERNLENTVHVQIDAVPIPDSKIQLLKSVFEEYAKKYELETEWFSDVKKFQFPFDDSLQYFYAEVPSVGVLFIRVTSEFPLSFARYVLADERIINQPKRIDWRKCCGTLEEETKISKKIRNDFASITK